MKILSNKFYNELVNSNSRLQSKLNAEISENSFLKAENASKNITIMWLHEKALKYDAELERQRVKNQKYREAKKKPESKEKKYGDIVVATNGEDVPFVDETVAKIHEVSDIEKFVKKSLGRKIKTDEGRIGEICGFNKESEQIILGFKNRFGWDYIEGKDIILKQYKSYCYRNFYSVKQQLSKTKSK